RPAVILPLRTGRHGRGRAKITVFSPGVVDVLVLVVAGGHEPEQHAGPPQFLEMPKDLVEVMDVDVAAVSGSGYPDRDQVAGVAGLRRGRKPAPVFLGLNRATQVLEDERPDVLGHSSSATSSSAGLLVAKSSMSGIT